MVNIAGIKCLLVWGFNLTAKRREKREGMKLDCSSICTICIWLQLTWPVSPYGNAHGNLIRRPAAFDCNLRDTWHYMNQSCVRGNWNVVLKLLVSPIIFFRYFPQMLSRYKRTEIIITIIAYFYQEIAIKWSLSQYYWTFFLFISDKLV